LLAGDGSWVMGEGSFLDIFSPVFMNKVIGYG